MPADTPSCFEKDGHAAWWGDALQVMEQHVPDGSIDLLFADPPYNIGKKFANFIDKWPSEIEYAEWCYRWIDLCVRKLSPRGSMYLMTSTQAMPYLDLYVRNRLTVLSRIVWHYDSSGVQARGHFGSMYEPILFCVKDPGDYTFNADEIKVEARTGAKRKLIDYRKPEPALYSSAKVPGNVWYFARVRYRMDEYENHPSQKPETLIERIIRASSKPDDLVMDLFSGTFTTSAVAKRLGRRSIGVEQQEEYVKIGLRRLGIRDDLNGEPLRAPPKTFIRRNGVGKGQKPTNNTL